MTHLPLSLSTDNAAERCRVSVIIPALNEERVIARCLGALAAMEYSRVEMEVILVDNGSKDQTVKIARSFEKSLNLRILEKSGVHISAMRNAGATESHGEILAFLDADCIVPRNWISTAVELLRDPAAGVAGAHYEIPSDSTWVGRVWYQDRMAEKVGDVKYVPSGDLCIRRETFFHVGGFDETIQTNEDFELCQRVLGSGFPVKSYPDLRVVHLGTPQTLKGFYRKQRWHGTHVLTVFLRDIRKGSNVRPVLFALYTFLGLMGIGFGALAGVFGYGWWVLGLSIAFLLSPSLLIALQRAASRRKWKDVLPASVLYFTFGLARAICILDFKTWGSPLDRGTDAVSAVKVRTSGNAPTGKDGQQAS
jgi:cellulose synthase/poly-beta-1,6-N-acetylglucosamine synthase-like glycosyltransferase